MKNFFPPAPVIARRDGNGGFDFEFRYRYDLIPYLRKSGEVHCHGNDEPNWHGEMAFGEQCHLCGAVT